MALAEASVRVVIEVARFERDLRDVVTKAAQRAGKDLERELSKGFSAAAKKGVADFRNAVNTQMLRAGKDAVTNFQAGMAAGLGSASQRLGSQIANGLRIPISAAGVQAGQGFANNVAATLQGQGGRVANQFVNSIGAGMASRGNTIGRNAGQSISRALTTASTAGASRAGRAAGRSFSLSFGFGSAAFSRPLAAAFAVIGTAAVESLRPTLGIISAIPGALSAVVASALITVAAFEGIGDAVKAVAEGDIDKINEAMRKLSPAAQSFVREFSAVRPLLGQLRRDIQDSFFRQVLGQTRELITAFAGPLRGSITGVSASMGQFVRAFVRGFSEIEGVANLDRFLRGTGDLLRQMTPGVRELTRGFLDFIGKTGPGLNSIGRELGRVFTRMGDFLSRSANSGQALRWIEGGITGLREFASTVADTARSIATLAQALQPISFALAGVLGLVNNLIRLFGLLPGPIQTAALAALLLTRSGLPGFLTSAGQRVTGLATSFTNLGTTFRNSTAPMLAFAAQQRQLNTVVGQSPSLISRAGSAFSTLGTAAAGAGTAIASGVAGAARGFIGFLGGPWGVALAAAGIGLSLLASEQDAARERTAAHNAAVAQLADTLNRSTGAVTASTRALAAQQFAQGSNGDAIRRLGLDLKLVADAATGNAGAQRALQTELRNSSRGALQASGNYERLQLTARNLEVSEDDLLDALNGNASALARVGAAASANGGRLDGFLAAFKDHIPDQQALGNAVNKTANDLARQAQVQRDVAASITPAQIAALKYADALGVLSDNTASADQKARALNEALNILAGGTIDAEVAQGRFTELLAQMDERLGDAVTGLNGMGAALLLQNGRINTSTTAGAFLVDTYQQLSSSLSTSAAATIEAGRANGDLDGALIQVAQQASAARAQFIQTAQSLGLGQAEAAKLADAYGLIPSQVLTTVTDQGSAQNVQFQVAAVNDRLKNLPPNTPVTVQGLTEDAIRKLNEVGIKTERLPDGQIKVTAETQDAKNSLQGLINSFAGRVINFVANIIGGNAAGNIIGNAKGNVLGYARGGQFRRLNPMSANRAQIVPPNTWRVIGDRATGDEAYIPINSSPRSQALLTETARRMGFQLLANGGVLGRNSTNTGPSVTVAPGAIVVNAPFADPVLVARQTLNELARQVAI